MADETLPPDPAENPANAAEPAPVAEEPHQPWRTDVESQPGYTPQSVPAWNDVETSDTYKNASPEDRLVAFDRWHNLAYNAAKKMPDWNQESKNFNQTAYDIHQKLSEDAGGIDPQTARLKMAKEAADAATTPEEKDAAVAALGQDVYKDYKTPPTFGQQLMRPLNSFGNAVARGLGETLKGAGYVGEEVYNRITGEEGHSWLGGLGDTLTSRADQLDNAIDPRTKGGISDVVGSTAGGLLEMLGETAIGGEALKGMALARKTKLGTEAVESVKALAGKLAGVGVFGIKNGEAGIEEARKQGASQDQILETFLADTTVGGATALLTPAQKWIKRFDEATSGGLMNTAKKALTEGGQFGLQMFAQQLGNNAVAKTVLGEDTDLLKDTIAQAKSGGVTGVIASLALSTLVHGKQAFTPAERKIQQATGKTPDQVVDNIKATAPATAEALKQKVTEQPAPEGASPVEEGAAPITHNVETGETNINIKPEHTAEQINGWIDQIAKSDLPDTAKQKLVDSIGQQLEARGEKAPEAQKLIDQVNEGLAKGEVSTPAIPAEPVTEQFPSRAEAEKFIAERSGDLLSHSITEESGKPGVSVTYRLKEEPKPVEPAAPATTGSKPVPSEPALAALPKFGGKAYRADTGFSNRGASAADVVKFEREHLGNENGVSPEVEKALEKYPAKDLKWVSKTPEVASRYGEAEEIEMPKHARVVGADGDGGYLVFVGKNPDVLDTGAPPVAEEGPSLAEREAAGEGGKTIRTSTARAEPELPTDAQKAQLEELDRQYRRNEISDDEFDKQEKAILGTEKPNITFTLPKPAETGGVKSASYKVGDIGEARKLYDKLSEDFRAAGGTDLPVRESWNSLNQANRALNTLRVRMDALREAPGKAEVPADKAPYVPTSEAGPAAPRSKGPSLSDRMERGVERGKRAAIAEEAKAALSESDTGTPDEIAAREKLTNVVTQAIKEGRAPTMDEVAAAGAVKQAPEAVRAKQVEGWKNLLETAREEGVVPTRDEVAKMIGGSPRSTNATKVLDAIKAKLAEKFPPETLPPGATETQPLTKENLREAREGEQDEIKNQRAQIHDDLDSIAKQKGLSVEDRRVAVAHLKRELAQLHERERGLSEAQRSPDQHPETGDFLPQVKEEDGTTRAKFTNDPSITAQQMDVGMFDNTAKRMYVPDEIVNADKVNPNIHLKFDKEAEQYYVDSVDAPIPLHDEAGRRIYVNPDKFQGKLKTYFARISGRDQFTEQYKATQVQAQKEVAAGTAEEAEAVSRASRRGEKATPEDETAWKGAAIEAGLSADDWEYVRSEAGDGVEEESHALAGEDAPAKPYEPTTDRARRNLESISKYITDSKGDRLGQVLRGAAVDESLPKDLRAAIKFILGTGLKTEKIPLYLSLVDQDGNLTNARGHYNSEYRQGIPGSYKANIDINPEANHPEGVISTLVHEAIHAVGLMKMDARLGYDLNPAEHEAIGHLNTLLESSRRQIADRLLGRTATPEEVKELSSYVDKPKTATGDTAIIRGIHRNPELFSSLYGLRSLGEFSAELTNPEFRHLLDGLKSDPKVPSPNTSKLSNMLDAMRKWLIQLLFGEKLPKDSILGQAMEHFFTAHKEAGQTEKLFKQPYEHAQSESIANYYPAKTPQAPAEAGVSFDEKPEAIQNDGWITPGGRYIEATNGHDEALLHHLQKTNPDFYVKIGGNEKTTGISIEDFEKLHDRAVQAGYTRVVGNEPGKPIYIDGNLNPLQRRELRDAALMQRSDVVKDNGPDRPPRTIVHASYAADVPPEIPTTKDLKDEKPAVHIEQRLSKEGKVVNDLKWSPDATRADLLAYSDKIDTMNINDNDKKRMKLQIAQALGPTLTAKQAKNVYIGYDSANNVANMLGRWARNKVADVFNGAVKMTPEIKKNLEAMPFVIEAGSKEELAKQLEAVRNSTDLKNEYRTGLEKTPGKTYYADLMQHALDNYDDLNGKKGVYQGLMNTMLQRERARGIQTGEVENYVSHMIKHGEDKNFWANVMEEMTGERGGVSSRYFIKGRHFATLAEALEKGYVPHSEGTEGATNLAELTQRRIELGERLVQMKAWEDQLRSTKLPNGGYILSPAQEYENFAGKGGYSRVPKGYTMVSTGSKPLIVADEVAPLFKALYGDSAMNANKFLRFLKQGTGFIKRNTLVFDTFHVGRILFKELAYGGDKGRLGYQNGLSMLEYSPETLQSLRDKGEINKQMFDYAKENHENAMTLINNGLNVGQVMDNLVAQHAAAIPGLKNFNPWVFQKLSRGAMLQASLSNFERNMKRNPELSRDEAAQKTAKEMNEVFGNLQNQSRIFRNKTFSDLTRVAALAPQWAMSQLAAEVRGYGQLARAPLDIAKGKGIGTVAQGHLTGILGMLAAAQVINYLSKGHSTFENDSDHKLEAYIPNFTDPKQKGFWFSPFEIISEYAMMAQRYASQHMQPVDIVTRIASNKLSPLGRGVSELATGRDYAGRKFETAGDRIRAAVEDTIPTPLPLTSVLEREPRSNLGFRVSRQPGSVEKQALQSLGVKLAPEMTPRSEMFALAYPFREDKSYSDRASEYRELRRALDTDQLGFAEQEVRGLVDRGKTWDQIRAGGGIDKGGGISKERFTGGTTEREREFVRSLTPDQKEKYNQAQVDHKENAKKLRDLMNRIRPELRDRFKANQRSHEGKPTAIE